jgi:hypothetical protein
MTRQGLRALNKGIRAHLFDGDRFPMDAGAAQLQQTGDFDGIASMQAQAVQVIAGYRSSSSSAHRRPRGRLHRPRLQAGRHRGHDRDRREALHPLHRRRRLTQLSLQPIYRTDAKNPLPWMDQMLNAIEHTNFFENHATEYSKGSTRGTWEEAFS